MKRILHLIAVACASPALAQDTPEPGIWTNTEDAYFAEEEGHQKPDWIGIEIREDKMWRKVDPFGEPLEDWQGIAIPGLIQDAKGEWSIEGSDLRRGRAFSCWVSVRKYAAKPNGSPDWSFTRGLKTHDQGGQIAIAGDGAAPDVVLRLRNVTWSEGSMNKPSLVLYIHRDDQERAVSYAWTAPDASLIGVNLRWIQASCSPSD